MLALAGRTLRPLERLLPACASAALPLLAAAQAAAAVVPGSSRGQAESTWQSAIRWQAYISSRSGSSSGSTAGSETHPQGSASQAQDEQQQQQQHVPLSGGRELQQHWEQQQQGWQQAHSQYDNDPYADPYAEDEEAHRDASSRLQEDAQFVEQRQQLLAAALRHVPELGWAGGAAAAAAARDLGLSPAAAGMLGSDAQLVQLFCADCNARLEAELAARQAELAGVEPRDRVRTGLQLRLSMLEPYIASWPQALALLARPNAAPRTLRLYAELADAIWHAAGDTSTDLTWYTKRALLTGVYSASELYMLTDCSPGFADTWAALGRRLDDAFELGAAAGDAGSLAGAVGGAAGAVVSQLSTLFRRPL